MSSRRIKPKGAIAGLRSIKTLGTLAVPGTLEQVPEEIEIKSSKCEIFASDDWKSIQKAIKDIFTEDIDLIQNGVLYQLHQNVKNILKSKTGTFFYDCYKEWLIREMSYLVGSIKLSEGDILHELEKIWSRFFTKTLPMLEAVLYIVKPKGRLSIRTTTLATFRDIVILSLDIEAAVRYNDAISPSIKQMIMVLQSINETYPPSKNKLRMEHIAAQICSPYMAYYGLYENGHLIVTSNEPMLAAKRRPSDTGAPRRISRPFSVQPQQMDTLNQMFKNAVRHRVLKSDGSQRKFR